MSGGCSLPSSLVLAEELSIAIFPQPLRSMAGNMVVGNSVGSCRLFCFYFHEFPVLVIIGQFSWAMENGKRAVPIAMDHHPHPDVMAAVFVRRDLKFSKKSKIIETWFRPDTLFHTSVCGQVQYIETSTSFLASIINSCHFCFHAASEDFVVLFPDIGTWVVPAALPVP